MNQNNRQNVEQQIGRLKKALGSIHEAIVCVDQECQIQWCNAVFAELIGKTEDEVQFSSFCQTFPLYSVGGNVLTEEEHPVLSTFRNQVTGEQNFLYLKDGKMKELHISGSLIKNSNAPPEVILTIQDYTKQKLMLVNLDRAKIQTELIQAKMNIQTEFTSTVSHELRTPLASIKSSIDIIHSETPGSLTQDQRMFLDKAKSNVDRLNRLINDILDLSKMESGKMEMYFEEMDINSVLQGIIEAESEVAKSKGLSFKYSLSEDLPTLNIDQDKIIQVFSNLINNAVKFTTDGCIAVETFFDPQKDEVVCSVKDSGIGVLKENQDRLFEKFQQVGSATNQVKGTGLGLAICKEIIKKHGGRIWLESEFGTGSVFYFSLPVKNGRR
ncbi:MAG: PAS domain-containing sensor histidine kinase [Candidatus Omnitrophica bacterium]|nr:PAS domain-containing sensor histidine kinase [Candidatus Omnitrophota bacterium]